MIDTELPPLVQELIDAPRAWLTPAQLAAHLDREEGEVADALCELDVSGWIDVSDLVVGPVVTLSLRAIQCLDLELTERNHEYCWIRVPRRRPAPAVESPPVETAPDPALGPEAEAIYQESLIELQTRRTERRRRRGLPIRLEDAPKPTVLLMGHALWPWTEHDKGPRPSVHCPKCHTVRKKRKILKTACVDCGRGLRRKPRLRVCAACKRRPISEDTLCLRCNRWGRQESGQGELVEKEAS